ncbi:hypothetical protein [Rickettsia tamurae]|uniref:hypothetical protein n=1 Tax=Rickettsia tamurae TaxID=334545 RepID=UPI000AD1C932|nr:hypothetical protein [Rickettsia tamurae]
MIDQNILTLNKALNNEELTVKYISGYDKNNIPHAIKHGIMLHIAEMYDRQATNCLGLSKEVKIYICLIEIYKFRKYGIHFDVIPTKALLRGPVFPSLRGNCIAIDEAIQLKIL